MINTIQDVRGEIEALWISARSTTQAMPDDAQELLNCAACACG